MEKIPTLMVMVTTLIDFQMTHNSGLILMVMVTVTIKDFQQATSAHSHSEIHLKGD